MVTFPPERQAEPIVDTDTMWFRPRSRDNEPSRRGDRSALCEAHHRWPRDTRVVVGAAPRSTAIRLAFGAFTCYTEGVCTRAGVLEAEEPSMAGLAQRVLVYDRVKRNRFVTRLLMTGFVVLALPVVVGLTWWSIPLALMYLEAPPGDVGALVTYAVGTLAAITLAGVLLAGLMVWRFGARMALRAARARPLIGDDHPTVVRLVENLSIGAGLPRPSLALVDTREANACAVGRTPATSTLAVTRGLLDLLSERELSGVIAHELAHIGNEDTRLDTTLAGLVATFAWPVTLPVGLLWSDWPVARVVGGGIVLLGAFILQGVIFSLRGVLDLWSDPVMWNPVLFWTSLFAALVPFYILFVAPLLAFAMRRAVGRQREFLADGEAVLLTRDPEGLALALAKIGAASGKLVGSESIAHLYVVDPTGGASPLHRVFPTHPSLEDRIGELARLGSGIEPGALERTMAAGAAFRLRFPEGETASESPECPANAEPSGHDAAWVDAAPVGEQKEADTSALVPIYERPDGWSTVVEWVPPGSPVRHLDESVGNFVRVETRNGTCGWASKLARLAADREPQG